MNVSDLLSLTAGGRKSRRYRQELVIPVLRRGFSERFTETYAFQFCLRSTLLVRLMKDFCPKRPISLGTLCTRTHFVLHLPLSPKVHFCYFLDSSLLDCGRVAGARWAGFNISDTDVLLGFSHTHTHSLQRLCIMVR